MGVLQLFAKKKVACYTTAFLGNFRCMSFCVFLGSRVIGRVARSFRGVAQLASVHALGAWGPGFESRLPDHLDVCLRRIFAKSLVFKGYPF